MWIERISLEDFLAFRTAVVEFDSGLNVILAPNEGGKSSLFRGIMTALFVDASSRSGEIRALGRWGSGSLFKVELHLRLGAANYRLVRDFRSKEQAIYRAGETGPIAKGKAVDGFLKEHLVLADQNLFLRVCGVRHEELARVSNGAAIGETIEEILGGGWGEMTPARFKQTVETKRRELLKGRDRPAYDENAGPVKRFMNGVEQAERELARARESMNRREELLRGLSSLDSSIERLNADIDILQSSRDKAVQHGEMAKAEKDMLGKAEELRKRIDRVKALASKKHELLREGVQFPEPLKAASGEAVEELRRELELEAVLEHEITRALGTAAEAPAAWADRSRLPWLIAAAALMLSGILGGILWKKPMFILLVLGIGCLVWFLWGLRGARTSVPAPERTRELERLAEKRKAWSGERNVNDSKSLLLGFTRWSGELRDVDSRLDELGAARKDDTDDLFHRLDDQYGKLALEARALGEERAKLEPFKADAGERLKLERDIRCEEGERENTAVERAQKEKELAALEHPDVNEIGERLETARENLAQAERKVGVMDLMLEALDGARREMSGFLAERLPPLAAAYLSRMTAGRYGALFIDPLTMDIETVPAAGDAAGGTAASHAPERIKPDMVSQGARDQIHLAVRLALLELLSHGEAQPLFLDDPFVHFDPMRRERAIELIRDFSRTHQVVLFTCDPFYRGLGQHLVELAR